MSRPMVTSQNKNNCSFGETIRNLRDKSGLPLRVVAAAVEIDSTLLSKLERGKRFPTDDQLKKFAKYFKLSFEEFSARVIADKFFFQYGEHPGVGDAIMFVRERMATYSGRKQ